VCHRARAAARRDPGSRAKDAALPRAVVATPAPCARSPTACRPSPARCRATAACPIPGVPVSPFRRPAPAGCRIGVPGLGRTGEMRTWARRRLSAWRRGSVHTVGPLGPAPEPAATTPAV
jgi:hypothetical protein